MTTFNTGWVLANGQEINWEYTNGLSDSSTVAKINDDKTFGNYVKKSEMEEEKAYYFYSSWQQNGSYIYLKKNGSFYKGFLENGSDKFTKDDIKRKSTDSDSDSESKESNYKTEVERTEKLQVKVQNIFGQIRAKATEHSIWYNNLSETPALIDNIISDKDSEIARRKRWASGIEFLTAHGGSYTNFTIRNSRLNLYFEPSLILFSSAEHDSIFAKYEKTGDNTAKVTYRGASYDGGFNIDEIKAGKYEEYTIYRIRGDSGDERVKWIAFE